MFLQGPGRKTACSAWELGKENTLSNWNQKVSKTLLEIREKHEYLNRCPRGNKDTREREKTSLENKISISDSSSFRTPSDCCTIQRYNRVKSYLYPVATCTGLLQHRTTITQKSLHWQTELQFAWKLENNTHPRLICTCPQSTKSPQPFAPQETPQVNVLDNSIWVESHHS